MKNHTIFGLLFLALILVLSSCSSKKPASSGVRYDTKVKVCFLNHSAKVAEIQFAGEKYVHKVHPQQELCLRRFPGTYRYNLTMGRKTTRNIAVDFEKGIVGEVALTFGR